MNSDVSDNVFQYRYALSVNWDNDNWNVESEFLDNFKMIDRAT